MTTSFAATDSPSTPAPAATAPSSRSDSPRLVSPPPDKGEDGAVGMFDDGLAPLPDLLLDPDTVPRRRTPVDDEDDELMCKPREEPGAALEPEPRIEAPHELNHESVRDAEESSEVEMEGVAEAEVMEADEAMEVEGLPEEEDDDSEDKNERGDTDPKLAEHLAYLTGLDDDYHVEEDSTHHVAAGSSNGFSAWGTSRRVADERPMSPQTPLSTSPLTPLPSELPDDDELAALTPLPEAVQSGPLAITTTSRDAGPSRPPPRLATLKRKSVTRDAADPPTATPESDADNGGEDKPKRKYNKITGLDGKPLRHSGKSRKRLDASIGITRDGEKPPEKVAPRARTLTEQKLKKELTGKTTELQLAPCIRKRYESWGKCVQCISKVGGDSCRFRTYRSFPIDPQTAKITGPGTFESTELELPLTEMPKEFNTELKESHCLRVEKTVAPLLLRLVTQELRHIAKNNAIHRPIDAALHRSVCDFCASTIFAGAWFCRTCGRDYCLTCERYFADDAASMGTSPWPLPDAARPRLHRCSFVRANPSSSNHFRPQLQASSRFTKEELLTNWLDLIDFVLDPSDKVSIDDQLRVMGIDAADEPELAATVQEWFESRQSQQPPASTTADAVLSEEQVAALYDASEGLPGVPDPAELESHKFMYIDADRLQNPEFDQLWSRGEPLVAYNILSRFTMDWGPDEFIRRFGHELCYVVECQTEKVETMEIGQFFTLFKERSGRRDEARDDDGEVNDGRANEEPQPASNGDPPTLDQAVGSPDKTTTTPHENGDAPEKVAEATSATANAEANGNREVKGNGEANGNGASSRASAVDDSQAENGSRQKKVVKATKEPILKLKDWPATDDFSTAYPDLYNDFCRALPVPDFTLRTGVMNLYSHFPPGPTRPDIGPKMYNAFAAQETAGGQGSTRLHMDVADAVNIMLYASDRPDGSPGCAVWDLFRAEDADAIRTFLTNKYSGKVGFNDPIHAQLFYLDSDIRRELYEKHGVKSFRVYQYPGQAVFIPAGCAHQVCNLSDCIKIALDFVSPHNVRRCQRLAQDFRQENFVKAWKDDVLQLYNIMWYAWTNVRETRKRQVDEAAVQDAEVARRRAQMSALASGDLGHHPSSIHSFRLTSSVRDDRAPTSPLSTEGRGTPQEQPSRGATPDTGDKDDSNNNSRNKSASASEDGPPSPKRALALRLLDAAMDREQPVPLLNIDRGRDRERELAESARTSPPATNSRRGIDRASLASKLAAAVSDMQAASESNYLDEL